TLLEHEGRDLRRYRKQPGTAFFFNDPEELEKLKLSSATANFCIPGPQQNRNPATVQAKEQMDEGRGGDLLADAQAELAAKKRMMMKTTTLSSSMRSISSSPQKVKGHSQYSKTASSPWHGSKTANVYDELASSRKARETAPHDLDGSNAVYLKENYAPILREDKHLKLVTTQNEMSIGQCEALLIERVEDFQRARKEALVEVG
ncbi:unnamed protein product, partial [Amoebophrya sp. A120]